MKDVDKVENVFELSGHATAVYDLSMGLDENKVLSASGDSFVVSWNLLERKPDEFSVKAEGGCYSTLYVPELNQLWVGRVNGDIHVIDTKSKKEIKHFKVHKKGVFSIAFLPQKKCVITGGGDGVLAVWHTQNEEGISLFRSIQLSDKKLRKIAVHPDRHSVAVASSNGLVYILETEWFNSVETLRADPSAVSGLAYHPTKPVVMSAGKHAHLKVWKIEKGEYELLINSPIHNEIVYDIVFSPDDHYFATCSRDKSIKVWDAQTLDLIVKIDRKLNGHRRSVNALFWSPSNILVSSGDDAKIMGWKIKD